MGEQVKGYSPFTQAVHISYGLQEALKELEETGGWSTRHRHYYNLSHKIRRGLQSLGIQTFLNEKDYSSVLTSFKFPQGYSYEQIHDFLKNEGFVIYAGQGIIKNTIFRIANMGNLHLEDVERLLDSCRNLFHRTAGV